MQTTTAWPSQDPTFPPSSQDDFHQFLDLDMTGLGESLQFEARDFSQAYAPHSCQQQDRQTLANKRVIGHGGATQDPTMSEQMSNSTIHSSPTIQVQPSSSDIAEIDAQIQYLQQQRQHQRQRRNTEQQRNFYMNHGYISPTPNSVEIQPANSQSYSILDSQSAGIYGRYRLQREQEMAFTPLASPAVTPLDTNSIISKYTVPGAYFSPLTSPALHDRSDHASSYSQRNSSTTTSPIESTCDTQSAPGSSIIFPRKANKKATSRARNARAVRQSPIVKSRKNKRSSSTTLPASALGEIRESTNVQRSRTMQVASTDTSEDGSISPEHLSDMAPPPLPPSGFIKHSPSVSAQKAKNIRPQRLPLGSPATPASLMKLTQSPISLEPSLMQDMDIDCNTLESFNLAEAMTNASTSFSYPHRSNSTQSSSQANSTANPIFSTQDPSFNPLASTSISTSLNPSDQVLTASQSPLPRQWKKRSSTVTTTTPSTLISPALLPRISPSIQPTNKSTPPTPNLTSSSASLLLASKSNYQNILEGTHLPGISYPTSLSTNLTSKRTSHKIAEQGRRNRINTALQEIGKLLPFSRKADEKDSANADADKNGKEDKSVASSSKASTVECAIEYIKLLQREVEEAKLRAERAERALEARGNM